MTAVYVMDVLWIFMDALFLSSTHGWIVCNMCTQGNTVENGCILIFCDRYGLISCQ